MILFENFGSYFIPWIYIVSRLYLAKFSFFKRCFCISADVYDDVSPDIESKGLDCECVGGGRIEHDSQEETADLWLLSGKCISNVPVMYIPVHHTWIYKQCTFTVEGVKLIHV